MHIPSYYGHALTTFHHAPSTLPLPLKPTTTTTTEPSEEDTTTAKTTTTLATLCTTATPPCHLNPLLFNGHLQTIYTALHPPDAVPINYKRRVFSSTDVRYPGTFAVDFAVHGTAASAEEKSKKGVEEDDDTDKGITDATVNPRTTLYTEAEWAALPEPSSTTPMLVALHGLSGGSHELYLRHVLSPLVNGIGTSPGTSPHGKWEACVVNARGCANSQITSPVLFNARATWDVRQVVAWLKEVFPKRPLFGVGFSLGGNILVNYLGEEGEACPLKAAVVCSNPWNLDVGSTALQSTWIGREVYSKSMATGLKALVEKNIEQMKKNPALDIEKIRECRYLHEFDREVQGPSWGYPTEGAYYRDASSTDPMLGVRIPLYAIHAEDDPVAPNEALPYQEVKQTPYVVLCTTSLGGHLSWFESGGGRWFVKPTVNFLRKMAEEVDLDALSAQRRPDAHASLVQNHAGRSFEPVRRRLVFQQATD